MRSTEPSRLTWMGKPCPSTQQILYQCDHKGLQSLLLALQGLSLHQRHGPGRQHSLGVTISQQYSKLSSLTLDLEPELFHSCLTPAWAGSCGALNSVLEENDGYPASNLSSVVSEKKLRTTQQYKYNTCHLNALSPPFEQVAVPGSRFPAAALSQHHTKGRSIHATDLREDLQQNYPRPAPQPCGLPGLKENRQRGDSSSPGMRGEVRLCERGSW